MSKTTKNRYLTPADFEKVARKVLKNKKTAKACLNAVRVKETV